MKKIILAVAFCSALCATAQTVITGNTVIQSGSSGVAGVQSINTASGAFTFTGSDVACSTTTCTFNGLPTTGGTLTGPVSGPSLPVNPLSYGATGNNSTDDSSAFQAAINAACAVVSVRGGVIELDIPIPATAYKIGSTLTLCSNLHIHGLGLPTLNFTGTGELFDIANGARNIEIDHLDMEGTQAANTFAILLASTSPIVSSLNNQIDHNLIYGFGTGTTGGGISIQNDSQRLTINNNILSDDTADILKNAPADNMHVYDNILQSYSAGGWCFDASNGTGGLASDAGAVTQYIDHNNDWLCGGTTTNGSGAMRLNSQSQWIIERNEAEETVAPDNAQNASWVFLNAGALTFVDNWNYAHGYPAFDFYVANTITQGFFERNAVGANSTNSGYAFSNGTGINNTYSGNTSGNGFAAVYSNANYAGIEGYSSTGGRSWGCSYSTVPGSFTFCSPTYFTSTSTTPYLPFNATLQPNLPTNSWMVGSEFGVANATASAGELLFFYDSTGANSRVGLATVNGQPAYVNESGAWIAPYLLATQLPSALVVGTSASGQLIGQAVHGSSATQVQGSDGTGTSGPAYFSSDGSITSSVVRSTQITGNTGAITGHVILPSVPASGMYHISFYANTTTAASAGTVYPVVSFNNGTSATYFGGGGCVLDLSQIASATGTTCGGGGVSFSSDVWLAVGGSVSVDWRIGTAISGSPVYAYSYSVQGPQ